MKNKLRILLVEDIADDAELIARQLQRAELHFEWRCVETRSDFLEQLHGFTPHLILSDYKLPGFDGLAALAIVREECPDTPFILVSGFLGEELAVEAMRNGATDYVLKERLWAVVPAVRRALGEIDERTKHRLLQQLSRESELEVKRTNELLRARDEQFAQITEGIREVFWITDITKKEMVYVSPGYEKIWGRTCESLLDNPQDWMNAIHPEDKQRVLDAALKKQIRGDYDEVYRIVRPDGAIRWIQDRAFPVRNAAGEIYRVSGIAEDITVRKEAEEALRESEDRFRTLFEYAPIGISLHDAGGKYIQVNRAYQKMAGYTEHELRERGVKGITHPEDVAEGRRLFGELLERKREYYQREKRYLKKGDEIIWAHSTASAVRYPDGKLRYIISMVEDVTERHLAEAKNAAILNAIPDFMLRVSRDGTVLDCKVPKLASFGITAEEYIGQNLFKRFGSRAKHPARHLQQALQNSLKSTLQTSEVQVFGFKLPLENGLHDFEARAVASGKNEVLAIVRDITEQRRLEKEVLEISEREQRRIGHDLHDELGQFLGAIAWKVKMLEQTLDENSNPLLPSVREIVSMVNNAIRQTRDLAKGLDPVGLVSEGLISALKQLARDTEKVFQIPCSHNCDESIPRLDRATGVQLYRIANEAVHNCVKHAKASRIQITVSQEPGRIILAIKDNGTGFHLESRIGAGLGLHIMQYRARSLGGYLEVRATQRRGKLFGPSQQQRRNIAE